MEAVTDPTAETETSSLPSDDTAVADLNEDKTTVTLTIQAPKRRTVCCSFDIYPEDKGSKWKLWWEKFFEIPLVFQSEMTVSSHFSSPLDGHIPKLSGKTNFKFPKSVWEDNFYRRRFPQLYGKTDFKVQCHSAHKPLTERIDRIEKWFLAKPHLCARYRYLRSWVDVIDLMILLFVLLSHARSEVRCCMLEAANLSVAILSDDFRFFGNETSKTYKPLRSVKAKNCLLGNLQKID